MLLMSPAVAGGRRVNSSVLSFVLVVNLIAGSGNAGGGEPPAEVFTLFRPFPDLTVPDQDGVPFRFRDHVDKLIVLHFCAARCSPCQNWTSESTLLQAELEAALGAGHFLLVDALVKNGAGVPSNQTLAQAQKVVSISPGRFDRILEYPVEPACVLGEGSYWVSVRPRTEIGSNEWWWQGGVLADEPDPAFRDPLDHFGTGCTDWASGGACFGSAPELCYLIGPPIALFTDGFETGDVARWSITEAAAEPAPDRMRVEAGDH